ncbi:MAG: hypothetical protein HY744_00890 [Deltaproteobacteria bacterium]|nr:hypothetical protein [Deltaproteobacteria bacterium]
MLERHAPAKLLAASLAFALGACSGQPGGPDEGAPPAPIELGARPGCNPLASTDECLFPFPSRFFEQGDPSTETGVRWSYPNDALALPEGATPMDLSRYDRADGAPPAAPILVHLGVDVDPGQLIDQRHIGDSLAPDAPIALFDLDTGERLPIVTEMDQNRRDTGEYDGRFALIVRPMVPMRMGSRHAVALRTTLRAAGGQPLAAPPGFAALRDRVPTTHPGLEAQRAAFEPLFAFLEGHGFARGELLLAWDFAVASQQHVLGAILSMREQTLAWIAEHGHDYAITGVHEDPNENTALLVEGVYAVPCFLTAQNAIERRPDGTVELQGACNFPFTMVVPAVAKEKGSLKLVHFGHGIFGSGRSYLEGSIGTDIIQPLAQSGEAVIVATDWIGLSEGDMDLIVDKVVADLNRITIVTDRLAQSLINNLVLTDLVLAKLQHDPLFDFGHGGLIAGDRVAYYGVSLGGIQGSSLVALSRNIDRAVLAVPGGAWSTMLPRSVVYQPIKAFVDAKYPDPLVQLAFISFLQGAFDLSDPINLSLLTFAQPLPDAPSGRQVLMQEAVGDCQVPNLVTRMVARTLGLSQLQPAAEPIYGLPPVSAPTTGAALAQYVMPDELAKYSPPDEAVVPTKDNGVHSGAVVLDAAMKQVRELLANGKIDHFCDGVCDPD